MKAMSLLVSWNAKNFQIKKVLHMEYGKAVTNWNQQTRINKLDWKYYTKGAPQKTE